MPRIGQRDVLPTSIKTRQIGSGVLYFFGPVFTFTDLLTLSNGEDSQITLTLSHDEEYDLLTPEVYTSIYVGSAEDPDYEIPGGTSITESQWIWTPFSFNYDRYKVTHFKARYKSVGKLYIRNVSAGASQNITLVLQVKYIAGAPS